MEKPGAQAFDPLPASKFDLLRHYTWASILIIVSVLIATSVVATHLAQRIYITIEQEEADSLTEDIVRRLAAHGYGPARWGSLSVAELKNSEVLKEIDNFDIGEITLFSMDGTPRASMGGSSVKKKSVDEARIRLAADGQATSVWEMRSWFRFLLPVPTNGWLETYVPVRLDGELVGVARVRRNMEKVLAGDYGAFPELLAVTGGSAIVVFVALWFVIRRADRHLKAQQAQIQEINANLAEANQRLHSVNGRLRDANLQKDQYLAICSHDIRSPLTGIYTGCQLLLREKTGVLTRAQRDIIERNLRSTRIVVELTGALLDLARIEAGQEGLNLATFDLLAMLRESIEMHRLRADEAQLRIVVESPRSPCPIQGDRLKLLRVASNLLTNAIKHSPRGSALRIMAHADDRNVRFTVRDEGPGIHPSDLPKLFDRFSALARHKATRDAGTGLGLSITKALVELHGGRIEVESEPGCGAAFTVELPHRAAPEEGSGRASPPVQAEEALEAVEKHA